MTDLAHDENDDQGRPTHVEHPTVDERRARGKVARRVSPRTNHAAWTAPAGRDAIAVLEAQAPTRVAELVPIRYGRMAANPFAFYRGAAAIMAADIAASTPRTHLDVQLCGDAHLANFGGFASPERSFVFDINDFDETHRGPFEWDLKRLAASIEIAARSRGFDAAIARTAVLKSVRHYRESMRTFASMRNLDLWYVRLDVDGIRARWGSDLGAKAMKTFERGVVKAESKDRLKAMAKLTTLVDGELRFLSDPPLLVPVEELFAELDPAAVHAGIQTAYHGYRRSLAGDRRHLLEGYRMVDLARKVVGVGSVGTRAWVLLLVGRDEGDPLFLQVKEAEASVLEPFSTKSGFANHGQRVVEGQRLMQAASDIFLGWQRTDGVDGRPHDYYMRQLWDWKASVNLEVIAPEILGIYAEMCAWTLARAHARSGDPIAISSYLGASDTFDNAIAEFAVAYADQNDRDHRALTDSITAGRIDATLGV